MEVIVIKPLYAFGQWWKKGDIIKSECYSCIQDLIKKGKVKKHETK